MIPDQGAIWRQAYSEMLGKRVRVTLDEDGPVVRVGKFIGFSDFGTFELEDQDGDVWHGWPMLRAEVIE